MSAGARSRRVLCLGEAGVDLVGHPADRPLGEIREWLPRPGQAIGAMAGELARAGTLVRLAGAVGRDRWGEWAAAQLAACGVDVSRLRALPGLATQLAFVGLDATGVPGRRCVQPPRETIDAALGDEIEELVECSDVLLIGTDSLAGPGERALTMWARERARALGRPIVLDATLELDRWSTRANAAASANACVPGARLVTLGEAEATLLTGEDDPERAALALRKAGAQLVAIRLAGGGALLRGAQRAQVAPPGARSAAAAVAAGADAPAFAATLVHRLVASGFYPPAVAAALPEAARAATSNSPPSAAVV